MDHSRLAAAQDRAAPHDHLVEFYETEDFLVATVADFLLPALCDGDAAVVVATPEHRAAFAAELTGAGIDLDAADVDGRYQSFDAAALLAQFMVDGAPDPDRFRAAATAVIDRAATGGRNVRVYGEMVALLWADGDVTSTIALEDLWNDLAATLSFSLFCAYPMQGFDDRARAAFKRICRQHSTVVPTEEYSQAAGAAERQRIVAELQHEAAALRAELERLRTADRS